MSYQTLTLATLLFLATPIHTCVANDPVPGPPTWIINAQIKTDGPRGQTQLIGTGVGLERYTTILD